mmetsp:Transcript_5593/g.13989  ORF Transcript_5593/g.13989 Transcript_5593/m.13989 type:complete len:111 (+) Transcript_5593:1-333(+)
MDFFATVLRGGVAGYRGSYRAARRWALERIYVFKEGYFRRYDKFIECVFCKRRKIESRRLVDGQALPQRVPTFAHNSESVTAMRETTQVHYDFTKLQHGVKSNMQLPVMD